MALNATNATLTPPGEAEYPYHTAVLTACYLVGALQIGYYGFYILFMGTDSVFKASRAFDYEDFDCQRKPVLQVSDELENNANSGGCVARDAASSMATTATATEDVEDNSNYAGEGGGTKKTDEELDQQLEETDVGDGDGVVGSSSSSHRRVGRPSGRGSRSGGNAEMAVRGGRGFAARGPLYRLMQSCSCMLVYKSDDEEEDDDEGESNDSEYDDQEESEDDESEDTCDENCSDDNSSGKRAKDRADGDATAAAAVATSAPAAPAAPSSSERHRHRREGDLRKSACAKRHPSGRQGRHQRDSHC